MVADELSQFQLRQLSCSHFGQSGLEEVGVEALDLVHEVLQRAVDLVQLVDLHAQLFYSLCFCSKILEKLMLCVSESADIVHCKLRLGLEEILRLGASWCSESSILSLSQLNLFVELLLLLA